MSRCIFSRVETIRELTDLIVRLCWNPRILLAGKCSGRTSPVCIGILPTPLFLLKFHRYLSTYAAAFFSLPVRLENGDILDHEEVVNQLDDLTVSYEAGLGLSDQFTEFARISFKVEVPHYESAIGWLRNLVWGAVFDKERRASNPNLS